MSPDTLEAIAARCIPGVGAVVVQPLASGLVNRSCRVERDGRVYSLRIGAPAVAGTSAEALGLDREWECRVLREACAAGLAPQVSLCLPGQGIVVAEWVSGRSWTPAESREAGAVAAMAQLLRRVHALVVPGPARLMDPGRWIEHYSTAALRGGGAHSPVVTRLRDVALQRLEALASLGPPPPVLCHSDLHAMNVLSSAGTARLQLLDWEYAHVSDGAWDLAGWAANNDWTPEEATDLHRAYLHRAPLPAETRRLQLHLWLYDYVCLLWSDLYVHRRADGEVAAVAGRAARLAARLTERSGSRAG